MKTNYMSNDQIEKTIFGMYLRFRELSGAQNKIDSFVDIDNFVTNFLHCTVVYESIAERNNCLGFVSDGVTRAWIRRNGKKKQVLYPADTIVLDKYLLSSANESKRRFTLGHEAGHVILNRIYVNQAAYYSHSFDNIIEYNKAMMMQEFNIMEMQADRVSACLLMPKPILLKYLEVYFDSDKVIRYEDGSFNQYDRSMLLKIAGDMKVSITALMIRLRELNLIEVRPHPSDNYYDKEEFPSESI